MPRIVENDALVDMHGASRLVRQFKMKAEDVDAWFKIERRLIDASDALRLHFPIPGSDSPPPPPSQFGYMRAHKSMAIAKRMIDLSRDWFRIWMGFLSFLISHLETYEDQDTSDPVPNWYRYLLSRDFSEAWLNGISMSAICSFGEQNPRCGIVLQWAALDRQCPGLKLFISRGIPMWFLWTKSEEEKVIDHPELQYLWPPDELLKRGIQLLFSRVDDSLPMASLILKHFYGLTDFNRETLTFLRLKEASSFVTEVVYNRLVLESSLPENSDSMLRQLNELLATSEADLQRAGAVASVLPSQGMVEKDDNYDRICNHWKDFFEGRERRQQELERVQSDQDRQRCASRATNPPIKSGRMYEWTRVRTSGGKEIYVRVRVSKRQNERVYHSYGEDERRYNAFYNEWDLCKEFSGKIPVVTGFSSDSDSNSDDDDWRFELGNDSMEVSNNALCESALQASKSCTPPRSRPCTPSHLPGPRTPPHLPGPRTPPHLPGPRTPPHLPGPRTPPHLPGPRTPPRLPQTPLPLSDVFVEPSAENDDLLVLYSTDMLRTLQGVYGYVLTMGGDVNPGNSISWNLIPPTLGFVSPSSFDEIQDQEKGGIRLFLHHLLMDYKNLPGDRDDLDDHNFMSLSLLFNWRHIKRTPDGLYIFHTPVSSACCWSLGVRSASVAIYVCRLIVSNPLVHTILTIAHHLLSRCIPFRTLLRVRSYPDDKSLSKKHSPVSFRRENYRFTELDFESAMLHCKAVLRTGEGRAAMLRGGILGRIAQEFLSLDGILDGPSAEVILHRAGFVTPAEQEGCSYWDDDLTEDEIAVVIGTYTMYTGKYLHSE